MFEDLLLGHYVYELLADDLKASLYVLADEVSHMISFDFISWLLLLFFYLVFLYYSIWQQRGSFVITSY